MRLTLTYTVSYRHTLLFASRSSLALLVPQKAVIAPFEHQLTAALTTLQEDVKLHGGKSKVMIFFPTAQHTSIAYSIFNNLAQQGVPGIPKCFQIQSRLTQGAREQAARRFKESESAWLFSSDVTARGVDFPAFVHLISTNNAPLLILNQCDHGPPNRYSSNGGTVRPQSG